LWAGTIHAFALEWILRPYAGYIDRIKNGFTVADDYFTRRTLNELRHDFGKSPFFDVNTARDRTGRTYNADESASTIFDSYQRRLQEEKLIDYDDVLYYSYKLLIDLPEIPDTLARIIRLICVDEVQDTQDLQYGILSTIHNAPENSRPSLFFVGDPDQCIYESLGAINKTSAEIAEEFDLADIGTRSLTGNYRSTQRIIDFYQLLRPLNPPIQSLTSFADERGAITFQNQTVSRDELSQRIAELIMQTLETGVPANKICVLAPQWVHVRSLGRSLVGLLPNIDFDAPGSSPFHSQRENLWFKIGRLFLTTPSPSLYRTRMRWSREILRELKEIYDFSVPENFQTPRALLRLINSIKSSAEDGLVFLDEVFGRLLTILGLSVDTFSQLSENKDLFFENARVRLDRDDVPSDTISFRKLFKHSNGVVINTCHGVKGEEFDTVIAFGLLRGYIPNWATINQSNAEDRASKLLYVICSRARKNLHLIAESGRFTQRNHYPYGTTRHLDDLEFEYDAEFAP
jgi:superfamily I DNA/RNA helicase